RTTPGIKAPAAPGDRQRLVSRLDPILPTYRIGQLTYISGRWWEVISGVVDVARPAWIGEQGTRAGLHPRPQSGVRQGDRALLRLPAVTGAKRPQCARVGWRAREPPDRHQPRIHVQPALPRARRTARADRASRGPIPAR